MLFIFLIGCASVKDSEIIGSWESISESQKVIITFKENGEYSAQSSGTDITAGTYKLKGNSIVMKPEKDKGDKRESEIQIKNDVMTIKYNDQVHKYNRKH
jgi:hypothetical protein